jgi:hypothetical protein
VAQKSKQGVNTRFDIYEGSLKHKKYPPAPNIITYPKDTVFITNPAPPGADSLRVGDGVWDRDDYWDTYHSHHDDILDEASRPSGWDTWTRWETYLWELDLNDDLVPQGNPHMPVNKDKWDLVTTPTPSDPLDPACDPDTTLDSDPLGDCHGAPRPAHFHCDGDDTACITNLYEAIYPSPDGVPYSTRPTHETPDEDVATHATRRVMYVAALECEALGLTGAFDEEDVDVLRDGEILQFLLTKYATHPGGDPNKFEIFGEYIGLTEEGSGLTRRIIQLYE